LSLSTNIITRNILDELEFFFTATLTYKLLIPH
jgi:hypothetical protein